MATITLKNIPEELRMQLKAKAAKHGRSLNQEILQDLRASVVEQRRDIEAELSETRKFREGLAARGLLASAEEIDAWKREGRP
jgi:plasmid stability protein